MTPYRKDHAVDRTMNRMSLARAPKADEKPEWQGRGTLAYVSEASKQDFLSLPAEVHARLQLASAQLNAQNSVVRRILGQKLAPLKITAVERYELARYKVDWPSPTAEQHTIAPPFPRKIKSTTMLARIRYEKTKEDYMEYLQAHIPHWELSTAHLQKLEDSRLELAGHAAGAIKNRMTELGLPTNSFTLALQCLGSFRSGLAVPSSEMDLVAITNGVPSAVQAELPSLFKQAFISEGHDVYSTKTNPVILTVREKPNTDALKNSTQVYHIHFSDFALKIQTTLLMRLYRAYDDRVYQMGVFIKHWAHARQIDSPNNGTLPSFCYMFMLLHYLMNVAKPPVVPNLQLSNIGPRDLELAEGNETAFWKKVAHASRQHKLTTNRQSTAELIRGFFTYYSPKDYNPQHRISKPRKFNWKDDVVSVRNPGYVSKSSKHWNAWYFEHGVRYHNFLAIEDPFSPNNNLAKNVTKESVFLLREEFERVNKIMNQAYFSPGFGWEYLDNDGYAGEDIFDERIPTDYVLEN